MARITTPFCAVAVPIAARIAANGAEFARAGSHGPSSERAPHRVHTILPPGAFTTARSCTCSRIDSDDNDIDRQGRTKMTALLDPESSFELLQRVKTGDTEA